MTKILGFILIAFLGLLLLSLVVTLVKLVIRLFASLAGGVLVGVMVNVAGQVSGKFDGPLTGSLVGCAAFVLFFVFDWKTGDKRSQAPPAAALEEDSPMEIQGFTRAKFLDPRLEKAWSFVEQQVPWREARLVKAGDACARLSLDPTLQLDPRPAELVSIVKSHVPALVEDCEKACAGASVVEAERTWATVADQLEEMGIQAEEFLRRGRASAEENLATRTRHVASRLGGLKSEASKF